MTGLYDLTLHSLWLDGALGDVELMVATFVANPCDMENRWSRGERSLFDPGNGSTSEWVCAAARFALPGVPLSQPVRPGDRLRVRVRNVGGRFATLSGGFDVSRIVGSRRDDGRPPVAVLR